MNEPLLLEVIQEVVDRMTHLESEMSTFFPLIQKLVTLATASDLPSNSLSCAFRPRTVHWNSPKPTGTPLSDLPAAPSTEFLRVLQSQQGPSVVDDWISRSRAGSIANLISESKVPLSRTETTREVRSRKTAASSGTERKGSMSSNDSIGEIKVVAESKDEVFERDEAARRGKLNSGLSSGGGRKLRGKSRLGGPAQDLPSNAASRDSHNSLNGKGFNGSRPDSTCSNKSRRSSLRSKISSPAGQILVSSVEESKGLANTTKSHVNIVVEPKQDVSAANNTLILSPARPVPTTNIFLTQFMNKRATNLLKPFIVPAMPRTASSTMILREGAIGLRTTLHRATVAPKYDSKGSLASEKPVSLRGVDEDEAPILAEMKRFTLSEGLNAKSAFSVNAQVAISLVMMSSIWLIPVSLAFEVELQVEYSCLLTLVYLADCILELVTFNSLHPAMNQVKEKQHLRKWQMYYLKHSFIFDAITLLPFELIPVASPDILQPRYLWAIRIIRLYKLPRIMSTSPKYRRLLKQLQHFFAIGHSGALIFPLLLIFFLFLHIQSCAIYLSGRIFDSTNPHIIDLQEGSVWQQYSWSLLTAVGNTFPVAYSPLTPSCRWIILAFVLVGAGMYAMIVGTLSSFAIGFDASGRLYKQKIDELRDYMQWKDLHPTTRKKILKYYDLKYNGKYFEENTLLNDLNDSLRMEIAVHNCKMLVRKVSFLNREQNDGRDELFMGRIASALRSSYFVAGDVLFIQGQMGEEMYFILSGSVNVLVNGKRVVSLTEGAFFGEVALIANIPRTATVQAATSTHLYCLSRTDFVEICEEFEDVRRRVNVIYQERMEKIQQEERRRKIAAAIEIGSKIEFLNRSEGDGRDEDFLLCLADSLVFESYAGGEAVFSQGELGDEMFFVKSGTVDIVVSNNRVSQLSDGAIFGEIALIANIPRTATVRAVTSCAMYKLSRAKLVKILSDFEDMRIRVDRLFAERLEKLKAEEDAK
ncbi:cyclic nucleotide-binding-like protein [Chytriomyces sp. MP71]|nr:cyclic nucleotide-binding-like protein [Chytriomyces sp. MP71]